MPRWKLAHAAHVITGGFQEPTAAAAMVKDEAHNAALGVDDDDDDESGEVNDLESRAFRQSIGVVAISRRAWQRELPEIVDRGAPQSTPTKGVAEEDGASGGGATAGSAADEPRSKYGRRGGAGGGAAGGMAASNTPESKKKLKEARRAAAKLRWKAAFARARVGAAEGMSKDEILAAHAVAPALLRRRHSQWDGLLGNLRSAAAKQQQQPTRPGSRATTTTQPLAGGVKSARRKGKRVLAARFIEHSELRRALLETLHLPVCVAVCSW